MIKCCLVSLLVGWLVMVGCEKTKHQTMGTAERKTSKNSYLFGKIDRFSDIHRYSQTDNCQTEQTDIISENWLV